MLNPKLLAKLIMSGGVRVGVLYVFLFVLD